MSQFREQLHVAQLSYHAPLYPDDLASQLLPARRALWPRIVGTVIAGAVAACMVMVLLSQTIAPPPQQHSERAAARRQSPAVVSIPGVPQMPNGELPAPNTGEQPLFLPSLPSFPSLGEVIGGPSQSNESPNESAKARESL